MRISLQNVNFSRLTRSQALEKIDSSRRSIVGGRVVTPNMHFFSVMRKYPNLLQMVNSHELILCDGVPLVWLSRLSTQPIPSRISGSDFLLDLMHYSSENALSVAFIGGNSETHQRIRSRIQDEFEGIRDAIFCHAVLPEASAIINEEKFMSAALTLQPDIFIIGLGFPKQENVSDLLSKFFPTAWFMNVGMGINYLSGEMIRCPRIFQSLGMEWLWRLLVEPKRLFRRYFLEDIPTFVYLLQKTLCQKK